MKTHLVRTHRSAEDFPKAEHLAWKIAEVATDPVEVPDATTEMIVNRIIDNAAVAAASLVRRPVTNARAQALAHPYTPGFDRLRRRRHLLARVGRVGQRRRGARTRLPRHVPGRRVLASR